MAAGGVRASADAYVTWEQFEPDKCASIWVIKRFIATDAEILFFKRGTTPPDGIPFDTPNAEFRRLHNKSTFETLVDGYSLSDPQVNYIARLIHDMEVNVWERKALPETRRVEAELVDLVSNSDVEHLVSACLAYFDSFYDRLVAGGVQ